MKGVGLAYWHPTTYRLLQKILYAGSYQQHYEALCTEIGDSSVVELCCGDCQIVDYLKGNVYQGLDIDPRFVDNARKRGLNVSLQDITVSEIPEAECVLMHNSLYQFYPNHAQIIRKALESAQRKLIISEPVVNLASSRNRIVSFIARRATSVCGHPSLKRFDRQEMENIFKEFNAEKAKFLGRNLMGVIAKSSGER